MELFQASESAFCVVAANPAGCGKCMAHLGTSKHRVISDGRRAVGYGGIRAGEMQALCLESAVSSTPSRAAAQ